MKVTLVDRIYKPERVNEIEITQALDFIRTGWCFGQDLRAITQRIYQEPDHEKQNQMKYWNLPVVLFNGTFSYKNNESCTSYSGLTAMDFDRFASEKDLQRVGYRLTITPCVYAIFRTPSGKGLKAIVAHDNSEPLFHEELYGQLLKKFFLPMTDGSVCDLSRGNYICHDPNLWVNASCVPYHFEHDSDHAPKSKGSSTGSTMVKDVATLKYMLSMKAVSGNKSDESIINILNSHWKKDSDRWCVGNRANSVFNSASQLCLAGVNMDKTITYLLKAYASTGLDENEILFQACRGYQANADRYGDTRNKFDMYGSKRKKK